MFRLKKITAWILCTCAIAGVIPAGQALLDGINWTWGSITGASEQTVAPGTI